MASSTGTSLGDVDSTEHTHSAASDDTAGTNQPQPNSSASPRPLKRASTTPILSATSSTASSPKPSREVSPVRPQLRPAISANSRTTRSRKNSQDFSPSRAPSTGPSNITTVPSAAAIRMHLSPPFFLLLVDSCNHLSGVKYRYQLPRQVANPNEHLCEQC